MTTVSSVGFVLFGLIDGQLDVDVVGDRVTSVGGQPTDLTVVPTSSVLLRRDWAQLFGMPEPMVPAVHRAPSGTGNR
jgi:hypothetical protein